MVGYMLADGGRILFDATGLARRKVADRGREARVGDPMRGAGQRRHEAARHFVLSLRARLEALQLVFDAIFDALVITGFEMQAVIVAAGTPVAAVKGVGADEED